MGLLAALVLVANAFVLGTGWASGAETERDGDVASAALALASTADLAAETELDPLEGVVARIPLRSSGTDPDAVLPVPEAVPADPYAPTPEVRHGLVEIPKIGLSQPLFEGVTLTAINRGPSHWPGTAMPGEVGNTVIAGHRTTYTKPFWALDELVPGDELIFTIDGERIVYRLDRIEIVQPTDVHIIDQTDGRTATLFACHPRGSARQRIVGHFTMEPEVDEVEVFDPIMGMHPVRSS